MVDRAGERRRSTRGEGRSRRWLVVASTVALLAGVLLAARPAEAAGGHRFPLGSCPGSWTYGSYKGHPTYGAHGAGLAIDVNAPGDLGKPVYATYRGTIYSINRTNGEITIKHPTGTRARYAHMKSIPSSFKKGSSIRQGQQIGRVGGVGAGGDGNAHLHYEQLNSNGSARSIRFRDQPVSYPWKRIRGNYYAFSGVKVKRSWC